MTYAYALDHPHALPDDDLRGLIGGKAANLGAMARQLGLPVPPGFVITTAACRAYLTDGWPEGLDAELRERIAVVESVVGRRFGDPSDPLLVSVRSGAPVSMPGMMDTILDLGLNEATTAGLAAVSGDPGFARDCGDRLAAMFRDIVGATRVPDDPWQQLRMAVEAVFRSWHSERARAYRLRERIPDDLGTAVTVQAMVFGNRGPTSATGVLFTRNPAMGEPSLYGDVLFDAQGEDVVAGTHRTEPLSSLDARLPSVAAELREDAIRLERSFADLCDIEFTIEQGKLWLLQVRVGKRSPQAALRIAVDMAEDATFPLSREEAVARVSAYLARPPTRVVSRSGHLVPLVTGWPASPGMARGRIVTSPEAAERAAEEGHPAILVRAETSPDDVHGMARAAGILTARGGLASHAAVVARGWGIPAVVGASSLEVHEDHLAIGRRIVPTGEVITIDGSTGEVFEGDIPSTTEIVPEARTLLGWARELGIPIGETGRADAAQTGDGTPPMSERRTDDERASLDAAAELAIRPAPATLDECLRTLSIKGAASAEAVAEAVLATPEEVRPLLDRLVLDGLAEASGDAIRLTDAGRMRGRDLLIADRDAWGSGAAAAALDSFLVLDQGTKEVITAWQVRDRGGEQAINDHSDPGYDAMILERLAALHADSVVWIDPFQRVHPRLGAYRARLARALERARTGDVRYVASPRVDSYHGAWFELHEELILLAGRSRTDEVAAGRA